MKSYSDEAAHQRFVYTNNIAEGIGKLTLVEILAVESLKQELKQLRCHHTNKRHRRHHHMQSPLDAAITATAAAEATYAADVTNQATIETAIAAATTPLDAAKAQTATDAVAFNAALDALSAAALAAKV